MASSPIFTPTMPVNRPSSVPAVNGEVTSNVRGTPAPRAAAYPQPGGAFAGFEIVSELGRGGMGRVFLARQTDMAGRAVVLKVGELLSGECQKLAKLQHPNVVPVYSFHQQGSLQAVCMPYRGPLTLGHLVSRLQKENLPTLSGSALTTVINDVRRTREKSLPQTTPAVIPADAPADHTGDRPMPRLRGLTFIDAVLTLVRQIAEGLRFAHSEGIVHSDLKPANVLIDEDGSPQLIDFGIAYDRTAPGVRELVIGCTRPYASPEQLNTVLRASIEHDHRTDLYSLGVVAYELTTGRLPFAANYDPSDEAIERDRAARFTPPPSPREGNPRVPPAVASIIARCLAPEPDQRYQSAEELIDDLNCQLARRPLKHAANPSRAELVAKWVSRNRWLLVAGITAGVLGTGAAAFAAHSSSQQERILTAEATAVVDEFERDARRAQVALGGTATDTATQDAGLRAAEQALARYGVLDGDRWWEQGAGVRLSPTQQVRVRQRVAELLLDMSRSAGTRSAQSSAAGDRRRWQERAMTWNTKAEAAFPTGQPPRGVWTQRAWLARLGGDTPTAESAAKVAAGITLTSAVDYRTEGRELMEQGKWQQAEEHLTKAVELDPSDFWASFHLGIAHYRRGDDREAIRAFEVCLSLDPTMPGVYFNRGLALLRSQQFVKAEEDFTRVIDNRPEWADPYPNRASAREAQGKFEAAAADLTKAIDLGYPPTAVLLTRSRVYSRMDKPELAKADREEGMKGLPTDEKGWITRGLLRMPKDGKGGVKAFADALADFDEALVVNPRSATARQCKARCYSMAGENTQAVAELSALLEVFPETLDALSGRAMLYSRLGERAKAHADAEEAMRLGEWKPQTAYQLAGVYAMTSKTHPDDKREAFRLLASALRNGFGYNLLDKDRELDSIRSEAEFSQVVEESKKAFERKVKQ
jgi:serine/threonine protein kinase/tetratricopeptide (TPR) repeat protein